MQDCILPLKNAGLYRLITDWRDTYLNFAMNFNKPHSFLVCFFIASSNFHHLSLSLSLSLSLCLCVSHSLCHSFYFSAFLPLSLSLSLSVCVCVTYARELESARVCSTDTRVS